MKCLGCDEEVVIGAEPTIFGTLALAMAGDEAWPMPVGSTERRVEMHLRCAPVAADRVRDEILDLRADAEEGRTRQRDAVAAAEQEARDAQAATAARAVAETQVASEVAETGGMVV